MTILRSRGLTNPEKTAEDYDLNNVKVRNFALYIFKHNLITKAIFFQIFFSL